MPESEGLATAIKAAFLVMFYTLKGSNDSYFNDSLEVAELKYHSRRSSGSSARTPSTSVAGDRLRPRPCAAGRWNSSKGGSRYIAAAQQAATALGLKTR